MRVNTSDIGKRVRLNWASPVDQQPRAEGRLVAHSLVPMVLIETDDGEMVWWRHDMAELMPERPNEERP